MAGKINGAETKPVDQPSESDSAIKAESADAPAREDNAGADEPSTTATADSERKSDSRDAFQVGDLVLVKITGFPWWPATIVTLEHLPDGARRAQPQKGKKGASTVLPLPVQFLGQPEYYWPRTTDIKPFSPEQAREWLSSGKKASNKQLKVAYEVATNPPSLDELMLGKQKFASAPEASDDDADENDDNDGEDAVDSENEAESDKDDDAAVDDEDDEPTSGARRGKGKKQTKRATAATPAKSAPASAKKSKATPKVTPNKRRQPEDPTSTDAADEKPSAKKRARKSVGTETSGSKVGKSTPSRQPAPAPTPEESAKDMWEKKKQTVMYLRHKLQKTLLSKDPATEENVSPVPKFLQQLDDLEVEPVIFRETKIGKVLSRISRLETIPRDDEFQIRKHVNELLAKWQKLLGHAESGLDAGGDTNGQSHTQSADTPVKPVSADDTKLPEQDEMSRGDVNGEGGPEPSTVNA